MSAVIGLEGALSIAAGGLGNVNAQLAVVSQNVSNASTADYTRELSSQTSVTAGGQGMGVATGTVNRAINTQLQTLSFAQNSVVAGLQTTQTALQSIDAVQGSVGGGADLASALGNLQNAFSTLQTDPPNQTQQSAVVSAAQALARQTNTISTAIVTARQNAQDNLTTEVASLNTSLGQIGSLSRQIVALKADGQSTADLENQRDAAMDAVSRLVDVRFMAQPNGDMLATTANGLNLPLQSSPASFSISPATLGPTSTYPGGSPGIMLQGVDVTSMLRGGQIGANVTLRDTTLPTYQGELDEFAETLSTRFSAQGLTLFSQPDGTVPAGGGTPTQAGYIGYAGSIEVNPAVAATPALVRDGTDSIAGSATGASAFTPNPTGGPAGSTTLISRVLTYTFGGNAQDGVTQPPPATTGLGASGTLAAPYAAPPDLSGLAVAVVTSQTQDSGNTTSQLTTETAVQGALQAQVTSAGGVNIDTEMSNMIQLQNAYGANAKIISAVQSMWTQLLNMVS
jgi:flagellar hook-associated protein 1 FlgK